MIKRMCNTDAINKTWDSDVINGTRKSVLKTRQNAEVTLRFHDFPTPTFTILQQLKSRPVSTWFIALPSIGTGGCVSWAPRYPSPPHPSTPIVNTSTCPSTITFH